MSTFKLAFLANILIFHGIIFCENIAFKKYDASRDREFVLNIIQQYPEYLSYEFLGHSAGTTEKYIKSKNYCTDILFVDDAPVGFVNYCAFNINFLTFHITRQGIIHLIGIEQKFQRQGYGKILLDHVINELKKQNSPTINLLVKAKNTRARELYEKAGFSRMHALEKFVSNQEDLMYSLTIDIPSELLLAEKNIIQRNPQTSLALACTALGGCFLWKLYQMIG